MPLALVVSDFARDVFALHRISCSVECHAPALVVVLRLYWLPRQM